MDLYEGHQTPLIIGLHRVLYLANIIDLYELPQTALTIALLGDI
jgi:hypothetical protein